MKESQVHEIYLKPRIKPYQLCGMLFQEICSGVIYYLKILNYVWWRISHNPLGARRKFGVPQILIRHPVYHIEFVSMLDVGCVSFGSVTSGALRAER